MTMLLRHSANFKGHTPKWLYDFLGIPEPKEDDVIDLAGQKFIQRNGILRNQLLLSENQAQTEKAFSFKWKSYIYTNGIRYNMITC